SQKPRTTTSSPISQAVFPVLDWKREKVSAAPDSGGSDGGCAPGAGGRLNVAWALGSLRPGGGTPLDYCNSYTPDGTDIGGDCTTTALLASECHSGRLRLSAAATTAGWLALSGSHSTKVGLSQLAITLQVGRWKDHHCTACHLRSPSNRSDHIRCAHSEVTARLRVTTCVGRSPSSTRRRGSSRSQIRRSSGNL